MESDGVGLTQSELRFWNLSYIATRLLARVIHFQASRCITVEQERIRFVVFEYVVLHYSI